MKLLREEFKISRWARNYIEEHIDDINRGDLDKVYAPDLEEQDVQELTRIFLKAGVYDIYNMTYLLKSMFKELPLTSANFPNCKEIDELAFAGCSSLTTVTFPVCSHICRDAFHGCRSLSQISFPACEYIDMWAFTNCTALSQISFPACRTIGDEVFHDCSSLTKADFPVCRIINDHAFINCTSLSQISFPRCIGIGYGAFDGCSKLTSANFSACEYVGSYAFANCEKLKTITFSNKLKRIDNSAFAWLGEGLTIYYDGAEEEWEKLRFENWQNIKVVFLK